MKFYFTHIASKTSNIPKHKLLEIPLYVVDMKESNVHTHFRLIYTVMHK